jgi:hypothetical protein
VHLRRATLLDDGDVAGCFADDLVDGGAKDGDGPAVAIRRGDRHAVPLGEQLTQALVECPGSLARHRVVRGDGAALLDHLTGWSRDA